MTEIQLKIKQLIASGDVKSAINLMLTITGSAGGDIHDEVVLLSSRWEQNENGNNKGVIPAADYNLERNRISDALQKLTYHVTLVGSGRSDDMLFDYLKWLAQQYEQVGKEYVNVRVAEYKGSDTTKNQYWFDEIISLADADISFRSEKVIILGDPGGGKSTCFQRMVWEIADRQQAGSEIAVIPVYLELKTYTEDKSNTKGLKPYEKILNYIAEEWNQIFVGQKNRLIFDLHFIETLLSENKFVFFFDGLNEVGDLFIEELLKSFHDFVRAYSGKKHRFFFSTRKLDFEYDFRKPFKDFHSLEILEFNGSAINEYILRDLGKINILLSDQKKGLLKDETVDEVVSKLEETRYYNPEEYLEKLIGHIGKNETYAPLISDLQKAQELISLLQQKEKILQIAQNPSILKDIIDAYGHQGDLPLNRSLIFESAINARFDRQSLKDNYKPKYSTKTKLDILQKIAFYMVDLGEGLNISKDNYLKIISFNKNLIEQHQAVEALEEITFKDGFLKKIDEKYSFIKQPYQEFFAAKEIKDIWFSNIERNRNPLKDGKVKLYFKKRSIFQTVALVSGLLNETEAYSLIHYLRENKRTQRLAAMCIQNAAELPKDYIESFIGWIDRRVIRFAYMPDRFMSLVLTFLFILSLVVGMHSDISENSLFVRNYFVSVVGTYRYTDMNSLFAIVSFGYNFCCWLLIKIINRFAQKPTVGTYGDNFLLFISIVFNFTYFFFQLSNEAVLLLQLGTIFISLHLTLKIILKTLYPAADYITRKIEDFFVYRYLIPSLEVMRDIGAHAKATMISTQAVMVRNQFMSERIKNIITKTWYISPQTFLKVAEEDLREENHLGEVVRNCEEWVMHIDTGNKDKSKGIQLIFDIIDRSRNRKKLGKDELGAILYAIEALGRIAKNTEVAEFRKYIVDKLSRLVNHELTYNYKIRSKACSVLNYYGLSHVTWPHSNIVEKIVYNLVASPVNIFIFILIILILLSLIN